MSETIDSPQSPIRAFYSIQDNMAVFLIFLMGSVVRDVSVLGPCETVLEQESMSPPSGDMICGRPSSCRAAHLQAPTVN